MLDVRAEKRALRAMIIERICALEPAERARQECSLIQRLEELPGFSMAGTVLLFVKAFPEEIETRTMLLRALELGKSLACPRIDRTARRLSLHELHDIERDLVPGSFGIPEPTADCPELEPEAIDWVLVPGLAFDARGYRLGRGAGYYDRLLPTLRTDVPRWALALEPQSVGMLPAEPHDERLDGVATATRIMAIDRKVDRTFLDFFR